MKNMKKHHKVIITLAACAVIAVGVAGTYAILTDVTGPVVNAFTGEEIKTHIDEPKFKGQEVKPGTDIRKDVKIVNDGPSDAFIRARVTISPSDVGVITEGMGENWEYNEADGWYYYKKVVPEVATETIDNKTTSLFTTVKLPENLKENFDVTVYQEAVGTGHYKAGEVASVADIKPLFDNITTKQDGN